MERLSHEELAVLNELIGGLYSLRDIHTFHSQALQLIRKSVHANSISYNEFDGSMRPVHLISDSEEHLSRYAKHLEGFRTYFYQHPCIPIAYTDRVSKTSEFGEIQFHRSQLYNEYYRHMDIDHQVVVPLPPERENMFLIALSRKARDFNENERTILTLLRPHIINAMRNVSELCRLKAERALLEKGVEAERHGAVLLDGEGTVLGMTPLARERMKKYLDSAPSEGYRIAGELLAWFRREAVTPPKRVERPPFVVEKDGGSVRITLVRDSTTGDCILLMKEMDAASTLKGLEKYGLSCREAETLIWVGKGKTNQEIGIILGISARTVEKHLERIYEKLGVETRTAAIAMINK